VILLRTRFAAVAAAGTEVDMKCSLAAFLFVLAAMFGSAPAGAQSIPSAANSAALQKILQTDLPPERMALAMKLVQASGMARVFDDVLPTIAEQSKTEFIRANPQMQLGIISIVDKIAVEMVKRRPELDRYLARIWASGFSNEEMQQLIDFYTTDTGKKFALGMPAILAVQTSAAQEWGRSVSEELNVRVQAELKAAVAAEQNALQSDIAGPAPAPEAAPQQ
jgi:hypothetical protein